MEKKQVVCWVRGAAVRHGFYGYGLITWLIVLNFSFSGLFVSWLQKYADTIVKVGRCTLTPGFCS